MPFLGLCIPDLEDVWNTLDHFPTLGSVSHLGQGLFFRGKDLPRGTKTYSAESFPGGVLGFVRLDNAPLLHELPTAYWMNLTPTAVDREVTGGTIGVPQILLNYAPASRGPWRLRALVDEQGHPVTNNFITVRPNDSVSLKTLWALLNGPVANGFAYSHLGRRHNIVGDIRKIPLPKRLHSITLDRAVAAYWGAAAENAAAAELANLLIHVDAEVLRLYGLPPTIEQQVLSIFSGWPRVGVPFVQTRFLPERLEAKLGLAEFIEFESSWPATNREHGRLIDKDIAGIITAHERARLDALQAYADYHLQKVSPRPTRLLDELERRLGDHKRYP